MAINFQNAFGFHEQALNLRTERAELLARNLANADTPGYKARDINFQQVLRDMNNQGAGMNTPLGVRNLQPAEGLQPVQGLQVDLMSKTDNRHFDTAAYKGRGNDSVAELQYRQPMQPSIDGNTVETEQELARFARNASDFQASMTLLNSKIRGILGAIKGE